MGVPEARKVMIIPHQGEKSNFSMPSASHCGDPWLSEPSRGHHDELSFLLSDIFSI